MTNSCNVVSCKMNHDGDGKIPDNLQKEWGVFVEKNCGSVNCSRRFTTKCCIWDNFEENK